MGSKAIRRLSNRLLDLCGTVSRPLVVAIDGRSGVGKSTLASKLASQLDATVVPGDDFFIGGVVVRNEDPATLFDACIDWQAARDVLHDLIEFGEAQLHRAEDWYLSMVISWDDFHFVMDSERLVEVRKS